MKIVKALRDIHDQCLPNYKILGAEVVDLLKPKLERRSWFFYSRLKSLESFALKVESGRVPNPNKLEDFFACTIVVATTAQIEEAEKLVLRHFDLSYRRPQDDSVTDKASSSFSFDDLRLFVARRAPASGRRPDLDGLVFEVQIKTTLQHAWSHATHDLIYKSNTISWPLERIAYQVKAMLEHAEVAIAEADRLADAAGVSKRDRQTIAVIQLIEKLRKTWGDGRLPEDVKRLAQALLELFGAADMEIDRFDDIVSAEKRRVGLLPQDLSPYAFTLQAVANFDIERFKKKFNRRHIRTSVLVHADMDLPDWMLNEHPRIVRP